MSAEVLLPFGVLRRARLHKPIYIHTHILFEFSSPPIYLSSLLLSPSLSPCLPQCRRPEPEAAVWPGQRLQHRTWVLPLPSARVLCCSQWSRLSSSGPLWNCASRTVDQILVSKVAKQLLFSPQLLMNLSGALSSATVRYGRCTAKSGRTWPGWGLWGVLSADPTHAPRTQTVWASSLWKEVQVQQHPHHQTETQLLKIKNTHNHRLSFNLHCSPHPHGHSELHCTFFIVFCCLNFTFLEFSIYTGTHSLCPVQRQ